MLLNQYQIAILATICGLTLVILARTILIFVYSKTNDLISAEMLKTGPLNIIEIMRKVSPNKGLQGVLALFILAISSLIHIIFSLTLIIQPQYSYSNNYTKFILIR